MHEAAIDEKEESITDKDAEITSLRAWIEALRELTPLGADVYAEQCDTRPKPVLEATQQCNHRGKLTHYMEMIQKYDWLPTLEQAAVWSNWFEEEHLIRSFARQSITRVKPLVS